MTKSSILLLITLPILWWGCSTESKRPVDETTQGKTVTIRDRKIYYEEYGQGIPLLLLSGGGITRSVKDFEKCIPLLSRHYKVIVPDTPGQGRSEQVDSLSYEIITETMSMLIDSLHIDSIYVMGWSDGGVVSLLLAEKRADKVMKIIAVGANNGLRGAVPPGMSIDSVMPLPVEGWERNNKEMVEAYKKAHPANDWKKLVQGLNEMWLAREYFPESVYDRITIPAMIVLGDRDDIIVEHGLEIHRKIKGSQLCVLPGTTHDVFAERPELMSTIALTFLKGE
jgi:pimeloyl-ACP methyl ester carboxylesterase